MAWLHSATKKYADLSSFCGKNDLIEDETIGRKATIKSDLPSESEKAKMTKRSWTFAELSELLTRKELSKKRRKASTTEQRTCHKCPELPTLATPYESMAHCVAVHLNDTLYRCRQCDFGTSSTSEVVDHRRKDHQDIRGAQELFDDDTDRYQAELVELLWLCLEPNTGNTVPNRNSCKEDEELIIAPKIPKEENKQKMLASKERGRPSTNHEATFEGLRNKRKENTMDDEATPAKTVRSQKRSSCHGFLHLTSSEFIIDKLFMFLL